MKLLYLANARIPTPRAYGLQIMKTCEAFVLAGLEVELVTPTRDYKTLGDPFVYYGVRTRFKITTLAVPDFLKYDALGFLASAIWFSEKARWLKSFWDADAIYSRDALILFQYLLLRRPLVFETHSKPSFLARVVARYARSVVVISHGLKQAYVAAGISEAKIIVAPDAVDEHLFDTVPAREETRTLLGLPAATHIVLYAGHLYPRKGADTLASAAGLLPDVLFVFVGGTEGDIAAFKRRWGTLPNVTIVGHVAHRKVPLYLRAAHVLVLPNSGKDKDSARFTSPMKLFEYMASGTPIVASDVPAIREILDETTAALVTPDEPEAFAKGVREVLTEPEKAHERAQRAYAKVGIYTWSKRAAVILARIRTE